MHNLTGMVTASGSSVANVVKTIAFVVNIEDFPKASTVYGEVFTGVSPARSAVQVARLPKDALVEIEAIAHVE